MCGITSIIKFEDTITEFETIKNMTDSQRHRGPDDQGFACFNLEDERLYENLEKSALGNIHGIIGFNRLSIQDISMQGHQPMVDTSQKVILAFNGEIYNADEYREELKKDFIFKSRTDTEVILNLYLKYGFDETIKKLNGMFAILLVDLRTSKIYTARDRMGIKPLYYTFINKELLISSEIKGFIYNKNFQRNINMEALEEFFTFGDPLYDNLLKNVNEVNPGEIIEIDFNDKYNFKKRKYFDLNNYERPQNTNKKAEEIYEHAEEILRKSVERQLISDVKVGCQLSGGIDSSLVTYCAKNSKKNPLQDTVSIVQNDKEYTEENYINYLSEKIGTTPHKFLLTSEFIFNNFKKAIWHYETIMTCHNTIALLLLSKEAKKHVTVLLSGEGADELFGGYTWFEDGYTVTNYLNIKNRLYENQRWDWLENQIRGLKNANNYGEFAIMATDTIPEAAAKKLLNFDFDQKKYFEKRLHFFNSFNGSDFDKHSKYELTTRLKHLLMRQDKTSMANSIENRVPILDNEMIDLAFSLPEEYLINPAKGEDKKHIANNQRVNQKVIGKYILKKLCAKHFSNDFVYRRKMGFPIPFHKYITTDGFKKIFYDIILPGIKRRNILNPLEVTHMYNLALGGGASLSERWQFVPLWKAINFEMWCQLFIDK